MKVSFIIRTYNEGAHLEEALKRVVNLRDSFEKEIIIVDSYSLDNTPSIAHKYGAKLVMVDREGFSWGKALNLGISASQGRYIVVLSAHCYICSQDFLVQCEKIFSQNRSIVALYGKQNPIPYVDPFEELELAEWYPIKECYIMNRDNVMSGSTIGISNACCVLKREAWELLKYDEHVQSMEDAIWAFGIINLGAEVAYSSNISIYHSHFFNTETIYRRWFWRTFEGLNFEQTLNRKNKIRTLKRVKIAAVKHFPHVLYVRYYADLKRAKQILKVYPFITSEHIRIYLHLKYNAMIDAVKAHSQEGFVNIKYSTLELPPLVTKYKESMIQIELNLTKNYHERLPQFH